MGRSLTRELALEKLTNILTEALHQYIKQSDVDTLITKCWDRVTVYAHFIHDEDERMKKLTALASPQQPSYDELKKLWDAVVGVVK